MMDDRSAKIGAQELDHESPKEEVAPDLEKKISDETSPSSTTHSIKDPEKSKGSSAQDVEAVREETTPPPVKIPRAKRRGLFGRFTLLAEVEEPKHYPPHTKWFITFIVGIAAVAAPLGSAIIFRRSAFICSLCSVLTDISCAPPDL